MSATAILRRIAGSVPVRVAADTYLHRYSRLRLAEIDRTDPVEAQTRTLRHLVQTARQTSFGRDHDFASIRTIGDYQKRVPLRSYEDFWRDYWQAVYPRLAGVTWPEFIPYYALSSGTTSGATKYLPVSRQMLKSNMKAAMTTLAYFMRSTPGARVFRGKIFFLGGSTDLKAQADGSFHGDLSGIAAREVSEIVRPYTFPPPDIGLLSDWDSKVKVLAEQSMHLPITVISGVPSWLLTLFDYLKKAARRQTVAEIWPKLQLVIHGGASFEPYRRVFREVIGNDHVKFQDTYPSSEGYVATEDPRHGMLRLLVDHQIFFEFVPMEELGKPNPARHTVANVETGVQYAVVMTTCAGLWSYIIGDTVAFEQRDPPLIRFTGRTKYFLSAFGEHLINEEIEKAVARAAEATGALVVDFHVGPVFPTEPSKPGHHRYLVEFSRPPSDLARFGAVIDEALHELNKDYVAYRVGGISLGPPEIRVVRPGGFNDWMRSKGKLGGQHKVPRMDNSGKITDELTQYFERHNGPAS
jgi:hypothetical protein